MEEQQKEFDNEAVEENPLEIVGDFDRGMQSDSAGSTSSFLESPNHLELSNLFIKESCTLR
jgi:hypothetical protein